MPRINSTQLSISLPREQADMVQALVDSGEYAGVSAVISDSLRALKARNAAIDKWLHEEVVPAYQALRDNPASGMSVNEARATYARRRTPKT